MQRSQPVVAVVAWAAAAGLVVLALSGWDHARRIAEFDVGTRTAALAAAMRSGAVGVAAIAQLLILYGVTVERRRPDRFDGVLRRLAAGVALAGFGGAVACVWVAR